MSASSPTRPRRRAACFVLAVALTVSLVSDARAREGADDAPAWADPTNGADIESALASVGLDPAWRSATGLNDTTRSMTVSYRDGDEAAVSRLLAVAASIDAIRDQHERLSTRLRVSAEAVADATELERRRLLQRNHADAHLQGVVALVQSVAVDLFAGSDDADRELLGHDGQALLHAQRIQELQGHTLDEMLERRARALEDLVTAEENLAATRRLLRTAEETHERLTAELLAVTQAGRDREAEARTLIPHAAEAFVLAGVPGEPNLTVRILDAYINAELTWTEQAPRCRISWRTIAAIGAVESAHGSVHGQTIGIDGTPGEPIVGVALDGETADGYGETVASIRDTDGGRWDDDPDYDRAVGPMQFIPQTWERWAADGDGDGTLDPQDVDDAAVATGGYLCAYGRHTDWEVWKAAVFGFNHSAHYVASVKAAHERLQRVQLPEIEGVELWPGRPWGSYVAMPIPDPDSTETGPVDLNDSSG